MHGAGASTKTKIQDLEKIMESEKLAECSFTPKIKKRVASSSASKWTVEGTLSANKKKAKEVKAVSKLVNNAE